MNVLVKIFFIVTLFRKIHTFCPVHLTISPNFRSLKEANLIVNWDPKCLDLPSKIRIYKENPYLKEVPALDEIIPKNFKDGRVDLKNIKLEDLELPAEWDIKNYQESNEKIIIKNEEGSCLNYFAISFNKTNHVINFECLKINPQWMSNTKDIWLFQLKNLIIPGSKCAGCYATNRNSKMKHLKDESFHQNVDIWHQLVFGVRYFDFSVGYFRSFHKSLDVRGRFWVFNDDHEISPIFPILEDILKFVEVSQEIVILDFRNFTYGFHESSGGHEIFKKLLQNMFGHIAVVNNGRDDVRSYDFTIQNIKSSSKNLLILYNHEDLTVVSELNETILWPKWDIREFKADENVVKALSIELSTKFLGDFSIGWILTTNTGSLNNSHIISALNGPWSAKINVISLDFILSTNLIDKCLQINHQKVLEKQNFVIINV